MTKLIIADDERVIRETISNLIDWEALGVTLVGLAADGNEAYSMILDESPDIVLTDIRMPGLSGLDLIRKTARSNSNIQFIILSGYSEFEYAQQAMEYGVRYYILKPCNEEQIIESIKKAQATIAERRPFWCLEAERQQFASTMYHQIFMNIIHDSLGGERDSRGYDPIFDKYQKFVDFKTEPYDAFRVTVNTEKMAWEVIQEAEAIRAEYAPGIFFSYLHIHNDLLLFFPAFRDEYPAVEARIGCVAGQPVERKAYACLAELATELIGRIARHESCRYSDGISVTTINNYRNRIRDINNCAAKLYDSDTASARKALDILMGQLSVISDLDLLRQLTSSLVLQAAARNICFTPVAATELLIEIGKMHDCAQITQRIFPQLERICKESHAANRTGKFSEDICTYVKDHISEPNLSLKWISENILFMNEDYVSKKFFRETGKKFSNYLTDIRIRKAKELMAGAEGDKIADIAEQVGCGNNPQYFSQIFKKQTGKTPTAYLRMIQGQRE